MDRFVQTFGPLGDLYAGDHVLRGTLDRLLGPAGHAAAKDQLERLAADAAGRLRDAHDDAEAHPPELVRYDGWGARVDQVRTSAGWETLRRAAAEYGLVATPYESESRAAFGAGVRVVQHAPVCAPCWPNTTFPTQRKTLSRTRPSAGRWRPRAGSRFRPA